MTSEALIDPALPVSRARPRIAVGDGADPVDVPPRPWRRMSG